MKRMLFEPFDLKKWLLVGLSCFLAEIASYTSNFSGNYGGSADGTGGNFSRNLDSLAGEWSGVVLGLGIGVIILIALLMIVLAVALLWVSCRGTFVFLHNVSRDRAEIVSPWKSYSPQAWKLFWFYLVFGGTALLLLFLWVAGILIGGEYGLWDTESVTGISLLVLPMVAGVVVWCFVVFGVDCLIVPRLYLSRGTFRQSVIDSWHCFCCDPGSWFLFMLFQIVLLVGIILVVCLSCLFTCCLAILPYIHHVLLLPVYVLTQAYGLKFLAQFGPDWDAFTQGPPSLFNQTGSS